MAVGDSDDGASEDVIEARVTEVTVFHEESHALTVTVNVEPVVWGSGVPSFPVPVPGAGDSPGTSTWSCE